MGIYTGVLMCFVTGAGMYWQALHCCSGVTALNVVYAGPQERCFWIGVMQGSRGNGRGSQATDSTKSYFKIGSSLCMQQLFRLNC